jgi:transcriptional regulator with XRE-family HTH domain
VSKHIGSTFASFLQEEGIKDEVELRAKKKIISDDIIAVMRRRRITRTDLAERMGTSRTLVNRLLNPSDTSVTFATLSRASRALHLELRITLRPRRPVRRRAG